MSFLSVLRSIGHGVQVGTGAIAPLVPVLGSIPGFGGPFATIFQAVTAAETLIPHDDGSGTQNAAKAAMVATVTQANHPDIPPSDIANATNALVAALKAMQQAMDLLQASVPKPV